MFGKVKRVFLSIELDNPNPLITLLLGCPICRLSLDLQLLLQWKLFDFLRFGMQKLLSSIGAEDILMIGGVRLIIIEP
jgi:hypothetical protein